MKKLFLILLITICGISFKLSAQANLLITPKRIVFEGNRPKKELLNLVNTGTHTAVYSISFFHYSMNENGGFAQIKEEDSLHMFSDPYLQVFPRKVTLAPHEAQVIALQYRSKPNMKAGEYRSHLFFRSEKENRPLDLDTVVSDTTKIKMKLTPIYGISIPIIIHSGAVNVSSTLSDLKIEMQNDTIPYLKLKINRTGNISIYGDVSVEYIPVQGKSNIIGKVSGVGVYADLSKRNLSVKLDKTPGMTLKNGMLKVTFASNDPTKKEVYAETELELK